MRERKIDDQIIDILLGKCQNYKLETNIDRYLQNNQHYDKLKRKQQECIKQALGNMISLCQGPPGTGKTFTAAALIWTLFNAGESVLVVCGSNFAADNLCAAAAAIGVSVCNFFNFNIKSSFSRFNFANMVKKNEIPSIELPKNSFIIYFFQQYFYNHSYSFYS